jgi:hypothetical protein
MSVCIRGGARYSRHKWEKQEALADVIACRHCGQIKGGVFADEQRSVEGQAEGIGSPIPNRVVPELLRTDERMSVSASDGGEVVLPARVSED